MQQSQYNSGQSLRQVQQFLVEHASAVPTADASAARQQLDSAIADLDQAAIEQDKLTRTVRGESQQADSLERTLVKKYLTPLAKLARASLKGVPEFAALTPSNREFRRERCVKTAQAMAEAASKHSAQLAEAQFPADFLDQLRSAAAAVQSSLDAGAGGRVRRTGVTKSILVAIAKGRQAVAALDALVGHTILGNEALEREWRSAKRVRRSAVDPKPSVATVVKPSPVIEVKAAA